MTIYLDLVIILNFIVDFLLLAGTNRLLGFPGPLWRCALAAAVGALYSGLCLMRGFSFLGNPLWRLISFAGMSVIAFGCSFSAFRRGGVFWILSMALGGIALSFGKGQFLPLVLCAAGLWLLCRMGFGDGMPGSEYLPVTLKREGITVRTTALRDTGNTLRDPITGEQVLVISAALAQQLTGLTPDQLASPLETMAGHSIPGLRLIPYRAVGGAGMLLALRFDSVTMGTREQSALVAFAPEEIGNGKLYQALAGGVI